MKHDTPMADALNDLRNAIDRVPIKAHTAEAQPLHEQLKRHNTRKGGPQLLRDTLPVALARLGLGSTRSSESGEADLPSL
jgi:hypothetical protein